MTKRIPIVPILLVVNTGAIVFALALILTRGEPTREMAVRLEPAGAQTSSPEATTRPATAMPSASWTAAEKLRQDGKPAAALVQYAALAEADDFVVFSPRGEGGAGKVEDHDTAAALDILNKRLLGLF